MTLLICRLRDRVTVKTGPRHIVRETDSGTFEMTIKSAVRSDAGIYTCKIINEYGTKQCEGKLQVQGMCHFRALCITEHINPGSVQLPWLWSFKHPFLNTQHHQLSLDWL